MRKYFDQELIALNKDMIHMSILVEKSMENMIESFKNHDMVLASQLIHNDRIINEYERKIETSCFHLLLTQQPLARDLRHITSILKAVTDLERIGDQVADITEMILEAKDQYEINDIELLYTMAKTSKKMVKYSIESFIDHDLEKANTVLQLEQSLNIDFNDIKNIIKSKIAENQADTYIDLLMIAKHLEKIGDYAVNICEWLQYEEKGSL